MSHLPILVIAIPLLFAFLIPLISMLFPSVRRITVTAMGLVYAGLVGMMIWGYHAMGVDRVIYPLGGWGPDVGIVLELDALSAAFAGIMGLGILLVILYSQDYMEAAESKYYVLLFIVASGIMGIILTADFFNLYVFIEMSAIASFPLVAVSRRGTALFASLYYMVFTLVSSALILLGIILVYAATGSLNMGEVAAVFDTIPELTRASIVGSFVIGLSVKVALIPFHSWLPPAHAEAVSPISALLSGVLLKNGVYMLMRLLPIFGFGDGSLDVRTLLLVIGVLTVIGGNVLAMGQGNVKRILACSSVAHMGYIALGIGIGGALGFAGALFHSLNHMLMKAGAFFSVGCIADGSFELSGLRGAALRTRPAGITFAMSTAGLIGLPPFGSFASKIMIMFAAIDAGMIGIAAVLPAGAVLSAIYYGRVYQVLYAPSEREPDDVSISPWQTTIVLVVTAVGSIATLVWAGNLARIFATIADYLVG